VIDHKIEIREETETWYTDGEKHFVEGALFFLLGLLGHPQEYI
jgi:hypothetical protein